MFKQLLKFIAFAVAVTLWASTVTLASFVGSYYLPH